MNDILMDYVCEELEDVERDGLKASNLESTDKLVNIKKNLMKIEKMEGEMNGYSMDGGYWNAEGGYGDGMGGGYSSARRGMHYVRGHYSRADGMMGGNAYRGNSYRGGMSYAQRRDRMGRYSRADGKEGMMEHLRMMMDEATTDKERKVIEEAMTKMERA